MESGCDGLFSLDLAEAACAEIENKPDGTMQEHCEPALFLVEYRDGFKGSVLMLNGYVTDLAYAGRVDGQIEACEFYLQGHGGESGAYAHFSYLSLNAEEMFVTDKPQYPVERTLLTSGILEADSTLLSRSRAIGDAVVRYVLSLADDFTWRPRGRRPAGACLDDFPPTGGA